MHIFLYEWITGGGLVEHAGALPASLLAEGSAMVAALAEDFSTVPSCHVSLLRDIRLTNSLPPVCAVSEIHSSSHHREQFDRLAAAADYALVVAPEFDRILQDTVCWIGEAGGQSLNASDEFIKIASDKHATANRLRAAGVPAPFGQVLAADEEKLPVDFAYPAVLKPLDGAGSQHTLLVASASDEPAPHPWPRRLEQFCPGSAASVAVLCGEATSILLPPCWQRLSTDGRFNYHGGAIIQELELIVRATDLAQRALAKMPPARGYIGVDLVLGAADDGGDDVIIEINPRVTTSYVGLRAALSQNLATLWLELAAGLAPEVDLRPRAIEFSADGTVWASR